MKHLLAAERPRRKIAAAFTLIETLVAMAIVGVVFVSLYSGMAYGFSTIRMSLENLRATQIMVEKMETIRLYTWEQINNANYIPKTFQASYYAANGQTNQGVIYSGTVDISKVDLNANYDKYTMLVTVTLNWKTGALPRSRSLTTLVSQNGLHNYIY